jgi:hypothetical protein
MPEDGFQQIVECDLTAVGVHLRFCGDYVRLPDMQLSRVLNEESSLVIWDGIGKYS